MRILVTGGCGFIGSAVIRDLLGPGSLGRHRVTNLDCLAKPASREAPIWEASEDSLSRYSLLVGDIRNRETVREALVAAEPEWVMHLAAETHVDESISTPQDFVSTNILGTSVLLEECLAYWRRLGPAGRESFRFLYVSTDEVFGECIAPGSTFNEDSPYRPRNPYAASKAAAGHLVKAFHNTYRFPAITTYSCNNFGPWQHHSKFVPMVLTRALRGLTIPIYGDGTQERDWIHVDDNANLLIRILGVGTPGKSYCVSRRQVAQNLHVARFLCQCVDDLRGNKESSNTRLLMNVRDRPGHDRRYAMDPAAMDSLLQAPYESSITLDLRKTAAWYCKNEAWWSWRL